MRRKIFDKLLTWKRSPDRKSLVLSGGRQTGKTWAMRNFGKQYYKSVVYVNLDTNGEAREYFRRNQDPEILLRYLESVCGHMILPGETLVILDELQAVPQARRCLEAFHIEAADFHVAGIEQESAWNGQIPYAQDEVEHLQLFPLDFEEFLWANREVALSKEIREHYQTMEPMKKAYHEKGIYLFLLYLIIGGFPASVEEYRKEKSLLMVPDAQRKLMDILMVEMLNRGPEGEGRHMKNCYNSIASQLMKENRKFMYRRVRRGGAAKLYDPAVKWLSDAQILLTCPKITNPEEMKQEEGCYKAYLSDTGLLTLQTGMGVHSLLAMEKSLFFDGVIENYLAQTFHQNAHRLYYWESGNQARLTFLLRKDHQWKAIEMKTAENQKTRSMAEFLKKYEPEHAYKMTLQNFSVSSQYDFIPFYAAFCI